MASGSIVIPERRGGGVFPLPRKALQSEVNTHCSVWDSYTGLYVRAPTLFSQSLLLQLRDGYFWQALSCPFPCTLALTAAVIVPALSKFLGRVWRNQTSELCTQVACNCSLFKCNYPGSVFSPRFALWAVGFMPLSCREQGAPLRLRWKPVFLLPPRAAEGAVVCLHVVSL